MERITNSGPVSDLLVMKFGGTSMGSAERIRVAARLTNRTKLEASRGGRGLSDV